MATFPQITSPPQSQAEVLVNEALETLEHVATYGKDPDTTSGLTWGYYGGRWGGFLISPGTFTLASSDTNYIVVEIATGIPTASNSVTNWNDDTNYARVYKITTGASAVTAVEDHRGGPGGVTGGAGGGGGGSSAAGSDKQIQYNSSGVFGAEAGFEYNASTNTFTVVNATTSGLLLTAASATGGAGFRLPHGAAPTSPTNGDVWTTSAGGLFARINGVTVGPYSASSTFAGGTLSSALNEAPDVTLASAGTVAIGAAAANTINISGTTGISAFDVIAAGAVRRTVFAGVLTLTHSSPALECLGSANITTAPGDSATWESQGSGNWRMLGYVRKTGTALTASGSLADWTEAIDSSAPNATITVASFTATNAATNVDAVLAPKGTGAILGRVPDNTSTGGNKRGLRAVDFQRSGASAANVASGAAAGLLAGVNNTAAGDHGVVVGGQSNSASGTDSAVVAGVSNTASGIAAIVAAGDTNTASGDYSCVPGGAYGTTRGIFGMYAYAAGRTTSLGDAQFGRYVQRFFTTNATPTALTTDGGAAATTNSITLPNNSCYCGESRIVARIDATDQAAFTIVWAVKRGANAASTALLGTPTVTTVGATAGAAALSVAAVVNTTNGSLEIRATGIAATFIKWVCVSDVTEETG